MEGDASIVAPTSSCCMSHLLAGVCLVDCSGLTCMATWPLYDPNIMHGLRCAIMQGWHMSCIRHVWPSANNRRYI